MRELLMEHGSHSLAYATLQPGMRYWQGINSFAAFRSPLGQPVFLGDPVCASAERDRTLDQITSAFPGALFMQVHRDTAGCLEASGYRITPVGVENEIDTAAFSLAGKRMADLRHYRNRARKGGVEVTEVGDTLAMRRQLRPVSDAWLPKKSWLRRELEFLARPFTDRPEPGVRIFTGCIAGRLAAFVILDPMYASGRVTGYTVSLLRHTPEAPEGAVDFIVLKVIEALAGEGIPLLSLGVSPFHRIDELARTFGRGNGPVYLLYRALWRWGNPIYHFRGLSFHKSRYRAREIPVFTAVPGPVGLWPLYAAARACRML